MVSLVIYRRYPLKLITLLGFGVLCGISAPDVRANRPTPLVGFWEIIMLGVFMRWVVALAIILQRKEEWAVSLTESKNDKFKAKTAGNGQHEIKMK